MVQQFKILLLSKEVLTDASLDIIYEWLYLWGAHPMCRPAGHISITEVSIFREGGVVYDWPLWRDRLNFQWYIIVGADTVRYLNSVCKDGRLTKYGLPVTILPHPDKAPSLADRHHENIADFVKEIFTWARMP